MAITSRAAWLMLPALLSACAPPTVNRLQKSAPVLEFNSSRDLVAVTSCISTAWLALGNTPKSVPRENGTMLVLGDLAPVLMVEATTIPAGTHVIMRQYKSYWSDNNRHRVEEVRACL